MMGWVLLLWEGVVTKGRLSSLGKRESLGRFGFNQGTKKAALNQLHNISTEPSLASGNEITHLGLRFSVMRRSEPLVDSLSGSARALYTSFYLMSTLFFTFFDYFYFLSTHVNSIFIQDVDSTKIRGFSSESSNFRPKYSHAILV